MSNIPVSPLAKPLSLVDRVWLSYGGSLTSSRDQGKPPRKLPTVVPTIWMAAWSLPPSPATYNG